MITPQTRPLRVLILGLNYAPEPIGIAAYTTGLAEHLARAGHRVSVIAGRPYYPQWRVYPGFEALAWKRSVEHGVVLTRCPHYVPAVPTGARRILHHMSFAAAALPVIIAPRAAVAACPGLRGRRRFCDRPDWWPVHQGRADRTRLALA